MIGWQIYLLKKVETENVQALILQNMNTLTLIAHKWLDAFNLHDVESILRLYNENAVTTVLN